MAPEQEIKGVPHSALPKRQLRFNAYGNSKHAKWGPRWCQADSNSAAFETPANGKLSPTAVPENLRQVEFGIVQAPLSFDSPVPQKKAFRPPFKVRLYLWYTGTLQVPIKIEASALPEQSIDQFIKHQGEALLVPTNLSQQNELECASISTCIQTHENEDKDLTENYSFEDIEFTELRFSKSSRMNRRWLIFSCKLGRDKLYAIYLQPTIVLSRKTDQQDKACQILRQTTFFMPDHWSSKLAPLTHLSSSPINRQQELQGPQAAQGYTANKNMASRPDQLRSYSGGLRINRDMIEQYILDKYGESGLSRSLTECEVAALCSRAGLKPQCSGDGRFDGVDSRSWFQFQTWMAACLKSLKTVDHLWSALDMMRICPLDVDRQLAERYLNDRSEGTFLVRLCSEPGAFAISSKVHLNWSLPEVKHVLIDGMDLKEKTLEMWIYADEWAQNLLDIQSGDCISKSIAFRRELPQSGNSPSVHGSYFVQPTLVWSPSPPMSSTTNVDPGTPNLDLEREVSDEVIGKEFSMAQFPSAPHHVMQHQSQARTQPRDLLYGQDEYSSKQHQGLNDAKGRTAQQMRGYEIVETRERHLKKRLSSKSVDTDIDFGERPAKRVFIDDSGLLITVPTCAIHTLDTINGVKHVNI